MISRKYHIAAISFIFLCLFCLGMGRIASAQKVGPIFDGTPSLDEKNLLDLINQARGNPLQMAASIGLDPNKILQDLPALKKILTQGLPALGFDKNLYNAANAHAEDMLANNYYSHDSLDGSSYDDRIRKTGYSPLTTGEALGFLAFNNFIEPGYAAQVIFEKMYKEELDPSRTAPRNILNPDLNEAGVSLVTGVFVSSGVPWNAYMAVVDFADSFDLYAVKKGLWRLINEARKSPLKVLDAAGIDEERARELLGENDWALNQGLPPLAWNENLEASAVSHYSEMSTFYYYNCFSPDGSTVSDRIAATGYEAAKAGEALGNAVIYESSDPAEIAFMIFESMLRAEFDPESRVDKVIFNPDPKEIGIGCGKIYIDPDESREGTAFIIVADFALPSDPSFSCWVMFMRIRMKISCIIWEKESKG